MASEDSKKYSKDSGGISSKLKDAQKYFPVESSVLLSSGYRMPLIGMGSSLVTDEETIKTYITNAIEVGYRHFDTALSYKNEDKIGCVLRSLIDMGKIKREEIFIVSKLPQIGMDPEHVEYFCKKSLTQLGLEYIDLYLIQTPMAMKRTPDDYAFVSLKDGIVDFGSADLVDTWHAMESLVRKGYVRSIGLSNFNSKQIQRVFDAAHIKPSNLQVECHVYLPRYELLEFCEKLNISVTAYSSLGSHYLVEHLRETRGFDKNAPVLMDDEIVKRIGKVYGKSPAQILLRYNVQRGIIVIPRSTHLKRIKENFEIFDFSLKDDDMKFLKSLENGYRYVKLDYWKGIVNHPEYPFKIPF